MKKLIAGILSAALVFSIVPGFASAAAAKKQAAAPVSSKQSDYYAASFNVTLKSSTSGAKVYYTVNGKTPTAKSAKYTKALKIAKTVTLKAIAVKTGFKNSSVSTYKYTFGKLTTNIVADGSTALQPLASSASPLFQAKYKNIFTGTVSISGGGSGTGLTDVSAGTVKIGDSDVSPDQIGSTATGLVDHKVCVVAVGIAVSDNVAKSLDSISTTDLKNIFDGSYTNWKSVKGWKGGSLPIQVYYRKANSGTRCLFEDFGSGVKKSDAQLASFQNFTKKESSGDLESAIDNQSSSAGAIGYETLPYCKNLKLLKFNNVKASYDNVYTGKYKIWGYEHMYTKGKPDNTIQAFISFMTSKDFESTVISSGYGLIGKMKVSR